MSREAGDRRIRVIVVDDHELIREGLTSLLRREPDIDLVALVATAEEALEVVPKVAPDVAVIDYNLPGMTGVELCERLAAEAPTVRTVMLSTYLLDTVIQGALKAGAMAFVFKDVHGDDLKNAIRMVAEGRPVVDPKIAGRVDRWRNRRTIATAEATFSRREIEVLRGVARGLSYRDIGVETGLTENTVKSYMRRAMQKLGCTSRSEAAAIAGRRGLL
jgi:DNA-binding NarL/FixJ family response regulator